METKYIKLELTSVPVLTGFEKLQLTPTASILKGRTTIRV